jgi:hypothetical protein
MAVTHWGIETSLSKVISLLNIQKKGVSFINVVKDVGGSLMAMRLASMRRFVRRFSSKRERFLTRLLKGSWKLRGSINSLKARIT